MANVFTTQKLVDANKRLLIKLTGKFDSGTQESNVTKIDASGLNFAKNTTNVHLLTLKKVISDVKSAAGYVELQWSGNSNTTIVTVGPGKGHLHFEPEGGSIKNENDGKNGDVLLSTLGFAANDAYTLILEFTKEASGFDMGQGKDPWAFNQHEANTPTPIV